MLAKFFYPYCHDEYLIQLHVLKIFVFQIKHFILSVLDIVHKLLVLYKNSIHCYLVFHLFIISVCVCVRACV
jgi:hypothetical protein